MIASEPSSENVEDDIEIAVEVAGFGKFNIKMLLISSLIFLNSAFSISSVGLVLPSAVCDFNLTTIDKSRMAAAPMLGMLFGSYPWGILADFGGRKYALMVALVSHGTFEIISSVIPKFWGFLVFQFLSGCCVTGHVAVVFTYLGEFQSPKVREKILSWMEMAWSMGLLLMPLVGWAIIPLEISYETDYFFFRSWNLFVLTCGVPSLFIALWFSTWPETPKYLAEVKDYTKLANTLELMHRENTGKSFDEYLEKLSKNGCGYLSARLKNPQPASFHSKGETETEGTSNLLANICTQAMQLFMPPLLFRSTIVSMKMLFIGSAYYAFMLWFPEVFQRFATFEEVFPDETASVCTVSQRQFVGNETDEIYDCPTHISSGVFVHTIILGGACVPLSFILPISIKKLGYKFYMILSSCVSATVSLGMFFVESSTQNLILFCIYEAFTSVSGSLLLCVIVDIFPTKLRGMASALSVFFLRLGAVMGNSLIGYLIDENCFTLITIISGQLLICIFLDVLLPTTRRKESTERPLDTKSIL